LPPANLIWQIQLDHLEIYSGRQLLGRQQLLFEVVTDQVSLVEHQDNHNVHFQNFA